MWLKMQMEEGKKNWKLLRKYVSSEKILKNEMRLPLVQSFERTFIRSIVRWTKFENQIKVLKN